MRAQRTIKTKEAINSFIEQIKKNICDELSQEEHQRLFNLLIDAWNVYIEEEKGGFEYFFNINNKEDIKCCLDGGLDIQSLCELYHKQDLLTGYFRFGATYENPVMFKTYKEIENYMLGSLDDIVRCMIAYHESQAYKNLFDYCISDFMLANDMAR